MNNECDKIIRANKMNKDKKSLILFRKINTTEISKSKGINKIDSTYSICLENGEEIGVITVSVINEKTASSVEMEYYITEEEEKNKGNISIGIQEVLEDVFKNRAYDGYNVKPIFPKTNIKNIYLSIDDTNHESIAVANKFGFENVNEGLYKLEEEKYLRMLKDKEKIKDSTIEDKQDNRSKASNDCQEYDR